MSSIAHHGRHGSAACAIGAVLWLGAATGAAQPVPRTLLTSAQFVDRSQLEIGRFEGSFLTCFGVFTRGQMAKRWIRRPPLSGNVGLDNICKLCE